MSAAYLECTLSVSEVEHTYHTQLHGIAGMLEEEEIILTKRC